MAKLTESHAVAYRLTEPELIELLRAQLSLLDDTLNKLHGATVRHSVFIDEDGYITISATQELTDDGI